MADRLALVCDVYCDFVTFPFGILRQVWYLLVSIPDLCCLSYFSKNLVRIEWTKQFERVKVLLERILSS